MSTTSDVETLSYEQALAELDLLIAQLERGDVNLNDAINAYQRGAQLAQRCAALLDSTEAAVTQLVVGAQGTVEERPFSAAGGEAGVASGAAARPARAAAAPVAPPPPTAPLRARGAQRPQPATSESGPAAAPGLFGGLEPGPAPPPPDEAAEFDLDDIPF
jgi:exodeoxyribonuclease VII small subunit